MSEVGFGRCVLVNLLRREGLGPALFMSLLLSIGGCASDSRGRPWVHDIALKGVKQLKKGDITDRIATEETSWIPLAPKKWLDNPFMIDTDRERIERYYQSRGYFQAQVQSTEVKPYKPGAVDVIFTLEEGPPSRITAIKVDGIAALPQREQARLTRNLGMRVGDTFDHRAYLKGRDDLERRLKGLSYAFAEVEGEVRVDRDRRQVEILLSARPGQKAVFGEVRVQGAQRTNPRDIIRHAALPVGAPFRLERLDEAQGKLYNLGVFGTVKMEPVKSPRGEGFADIQITVSEGLFREIRLGGGLGLESLRTDVRLRALYTQRNFLGRLRTLRLNIEPGWALLPNFWSTIQRQGPVLNLGAQLTQPDVVGNNSELRYSLGYDLGVEYAYQVHGPRTSLGLQRTLWANRVALSGSVNFQFLDFFFVNPGLETNKFAEVLYGFIDPYFLTYLQQDVSLDLRDRQIDARRGGYFALNLEEGAYFSVTDRLGGVALPGSRALSTFYLKLQPEVRGYLPLGRRVVLAARATFGQAFASGDLSTPITRRFFLGGPNSHRGFNYNRLSLQVCSEKLIGAPLNTAVYQPDCGATPQMGMEILRLPVGGDQLFLAQGEVRVSVVKLFKNWLLLAGFMDIGDVAAPRCSGSACTALSGYLQSVDFTRLHVAVGGGLRYQTLVGTIRADLGVRLNRLAEREPDGLPNPDPGQRLVFHISIGEAF